MPATLLPRALGVRVGRRDAIRIQIRTAAPRLAELEIVEHVRIEFLVLAIEERRQCSASSGPSRKHTNVSVDPRTAWRASLSKRSRNCVATVTLAANFLASVSKCRDDAGAKILRLVDDDVERTPITRITLARHDGGLRTRKKK